MKKSYTAPMTYMTAMMHECDILKASTPLTKREVEGYPYSEDDFQHGTPGIGETASGGDTYDGHGQGIGGGGNRGKELDLWGFDSFDLWN